MSVVDPALAHGVVEQPSEEVEEDALHLILGELDDPNKYIPPALHESDQLTTHVVPLLQHKT